MSGFCMTVPGGNWRSRGGAVNTASDRPFAPCTARLRPSRPGANSGAPLDIACRRYAMTCGIRFGPRLAPLALGAVFALLASSPSLAAQAQATTGIIRGIVTDPSGNDLGGARATVTDVQAQFQRTVVSNENGGLVA